MTDNKLVTPNAGTQKRVYRAPRIVEFGPVRNITGSGTGTTTENMGGQASKMP